MYVCMYVCMYTVCVYTHTYIYMHTGRAILDALGESFAEQGAFFMSYALVSTFISLALELLRVAPAIMALLRYACVYCVCVCVHV